MRSAHRSTTLRTCATGRLGERLAVLGREQHDLARADRGHRRAVPRAGRRRSPRSRPARPGASAGQRFGEPAHVVRLGRLEPADAERAAVARQVRPRLAVADDVHPLAGERVEAQLAAACGRVADASSERLVTSPYLQDGTHARRPRRSHEIRKMTVDDCPAVARVQARAFFDDPLQVVGAARRVDPAVDPRAGVRAAEPVLERAARRVVHRRDALVRGVLGAARAVRDRPRGRRRDGADARPARRRQRPVPRRRGHDARAPAGASCTSTCRVSAPIRRARVRGSPRPRCNRCSTRCDAEGIPAYLESTKERNVGFYERHGFAVVGLRADPARRPAALADVARRRAERVGSGRVGRPR